MNPLFLFGTLRYLPLLNVVVGRVPQAAAACLPGHCAQSVAGEAFPLLVSDTSAAAEGLLVSDLTARERERIRYYEAGFDYDVVCETVMTDDGPVAADVFRSAACKPSGRPWNLSAWAEEHGPTAVEAAGEIMRAFEAGVSADALAPRLDIIWSRAHSTTLTSRSPRPATCGCEGRAEDVKIDAQEPVYEGFFRVEEVTIRHKSHAGEEIGPMQRAVFHVSDAVTVLPYDPVRDRVLLIEQLRIGALAHGDRQPWMLEPVAGMIDAGETPEETAIRETHEEARLALQPGDLHHIATYYPSPGGVAQRFISYVAVTPLPDEAAGLGGEASEHEDLRAHLVSFGTLMEMVASGEAANAALIVSAQWLKEARDRLQASA